MRNQISLSQSSVVHIFLLAFSCSTLMFLCAETALPQTEQAQTEQAQTKQAQTKDEQFESRKGLPRGLLREPPIPKVCSQQQGNLINMLVVGDSILWGQGLKEENKISFRVQEWLCKQTARPVKVWREAHSGAVLRTDETKQPDFSKRARELYESARLTKLTKESNLSEELDGEVNVSEPTIPEQLAHASKHFQGRQVDFVLMDGCGNDFAFQNFIDPHMTKDQIEKRAQEVCYERMTPVLEDAAERFPNARIVLTGYYPIITEKSAKNAFLRFILGWVFPVEKHKWLFPNAKKQLFQKLIVVSKQWTESSNTALRRSVAEANLKANNRIAFAQINHKPDKGFGSVGSGFAAPKKSTLLWTSRFNSTGRTGLSKAFYVLFVLNFHPIRPNDEVYFDRRRACKDAGFGGFPALKCKLAAWGHPNKIGVGEYVEAVTKELRRLMETTDWLDAER